MPFSNDYYLGIAASNDLIGKKERWLYRFLETLPGLLSFGTLFLALVFSWLLPAVASVFIILFSAFWLTRTFYFVFHLWFGYKEMDKGLKIDWLNELEKMSKDEYSLKIDSWKELYHLIVITISKEPVEIVRETIGAIYKSTYPKNRMIIVIGCEQRFAETNKITAEKIKNEFGGSFFRFLVSWHPDGLADEIAGKASNETWAVKEAKTKIIDPLGIAYEKIIFSTFDADTVVFPRYFSCLSWHYLNASEPALASYQPIPLYSNNLISAPAISRVFSFSSTFWQIMNQERPEKMITFSSHSMSFKTLFEVGFKNPRVVSDDSRIFWQCFLKFNGNYRVIPLFYPVSMDANVAKTFWQTLKNIYKQQKRWAYGAGEIPYIIFGFLKNKKIALKRKITIALEMIEGHWSWAVVSFLIFFLGWLPIVLGGGNFSQTALSYNLPRAVGLFSRIAMAGMIVSAYFSVLIAFKKTVIESKIQLFFFVSGWLLMPIIMIFFSSLPALDAQGHWLLGKRLGFWVTEKNR